jgi:hypothetical protein
MKLTKSQAFAVDQWLSDCPDNWSYKQILAYLNRTTWLGSESKISPWEVVENFTGDQIAEFIEDTRQAFERAIMEEALV